MKKRIVLCADDYGQEQEISEGIYSLLEWGVLSATSCLVTSSYWFEHATWLKRFESWIDIGLHFNLTEGKPLSQEFYDAYGTAFFSLKDMLLRSTLRQLNPQVIAAEFTAQLDAFVAATGKLPDFIDGHQHVHQFPIVREAILRVYKERQLTAYMRLVDPPISDLAIKNLMIKLSGGYRMRQLYTAAQIPHNPSFAGIYDFKQAINYPIFFRQFMEKIGDNGIIMCHPAGSISKDSIGLARQKEYKYFNSSDFERDCLHAQVTIGTLARPFKV